MGTIVEDSGKFYLVESGRVVKASTDKESLLYKSACDCECESCEGEGEGHCAACLAGEDKKKHHKSFVIGDRVEVNDKLGNIISSMITVFGTAFGVRLDNGDLDSAYAEHLKHSDIEAPSYESAIDELVSEFERYEGCPCHTLAEVKEKSAIARSLNVRAKALMTDPTLALGEQVLADRIITATAHDISVLKDEELEHLATSEYVRNQPRFQLPEEVLPSSRWAREDASWLEVEADAAQQEIADIDWDTYLAEQAVTLADQVESIEDEEIFDTAVESRFARLASHAFAGEDYSARAEQFKSLVKEAYASRPAPKVASVVELPETDDPSFLWS